MEQVAIVVRVDQRLIWRIPLIENQSFGIGRSSDNHVHLDGEDPSRVSTPRYAGGTVRTS
ncbi:MAG TPA: hypothetical protein PLF40_02325 [Kofleriaceae bacterium]|nr:hypothetical protein [Kofleriaceae bacterium]